MSRKAQLQKMKDVLLRRLDALRQAMNGDDNLLRNFSQQTGGDVVDFACDSANVEIGSQLAEAGAREINRIETALKNLKDGSYGQCEACEKPIPLARLQALPYATLCIHCKRAAEEAGVDPSKVVDWSQILDNDASSSDMGFNFT